MRPAKQTLHERGRDEPCTFSPNRAELLRSCDILASPPCGWRMAWCQFGCLQAHFFGPPASQSGMKTDRPRCMTASWQLPAAFRTKNEKRLEQELRHTFVNPSWPVHNHINTLECMNGATNE